ncbi:C-reactive protein-like [Bufo gargarizans]|uniref:C-reactive protein-like n=1 Tax=Bufo gargarizans TaxID=30331 RepID=UPI001CF4A269|nr:C-reactive protein-like [Bufo gargarizans]
MRYSGPIKSESRMNFPVLLLVVISGCCANENLHGASFVFYKIGRTAKVVLKPTTTEPLSNITVCLQSYSDTTQKDSLFKLKNENNSIALFQLYRQLDYYFIVLDQQYVYYKVSEESMEWRLICVTWESSTGIIHLVVNGKLFPRKVLKPGFIIDPKVIAVLRQDLA